MANGNKRLFIKGYLERISKQFEIKKNDAFVIFSMAAILDKPFDELYEKNKKLIESKADGGIDGLYFEEAERGAIIHVFQGKNRAKLSENAIRKFIDDYENIFERGLIEGRPNAQGLKPYYERYERLTQAGKAVSAKLYFAYNASEADNSIIDGNRGVESQFSSSADLEIWNDDRLFENIDRLINFYERRNKVDFTFEPEHSNISTKQDPQSVITFSIYGIQAVTFRLNAKKLCELLNLEKKLNGSFEKIFADNIRGYLGKDNSTNKKIAETLDSEAKRAYFPFLNNGLTVICENIQMPRNPQAGMYVVPCTNPVIVNGLQTTHTIYNKYLEDPDSIDEVYVTIRLYETRDEDLIDLITEATNTQSQIFYSDQLSNKRFTKYAQELFTNKGIALIAKRGDVFRNEASVMINKSVHFSELLEVWGVCFLNLLHFDDSPNDASELSGENTSQLLLELIRGDSDESNEQKTSSFHTQLIVCYAIYIEARAMLSEIQAQLGISDSEERPDVPKEVATRFFYYPIYRAMVSLIGKNKFADISYENIKAASESIQEDILSLPEVKRIYFGDKVFAPSVEFTVGLVAQDSLQKIWSQSINSFREAISETPLGELYIDIENLHLT